MRKLLFRLGSWAHSAQMSNSDRRATFGELVIMGLSFRITALACAAVVAFVVGAASPAQADKRVALVIGNSAYKNVTPLDNPKNDARLMADTLRGLGFTPQRSAGTPKAD